MKKKIVLTMLVMVGGCIRAESNAINVAAEHFAKMKLVLVCIGDNPLVKECAQVMQNDLSFSGQFDVSLECSSMRPSRKLFDSWHAQGKLVAIFLNVTDDKEAFEWRIYDTNKVMMLKGKRYQKRGTLPRGWAHNMADMIWPELIGQDGSFSTKIAFAKEINSSKKHPHLHIYVADYDGSHVEPLVATPTVNVAPRWNKDVGNPLLFYSESSKSNISLRVVDMNGHRRVASNFDGLNMLPAFSKDGKKVIYCMSHGDGHCDLYKYENEQLKQLTHNKGNNISPTIDEDSDSIYFCSDYKHGLPLIYRYDCKRGSTEQITDKGPCFSPSYCEKNKKLAYIKRVNGVMQIFIYDPKTRKHTQFTTDGTFHKEECGWSPCGNYLLFCLTSGNANQLAIEHVGTHQRRIIAEQGCYPSWSPLYQEFPVLRT